MSTADKLREEGNERFKEGRMSEAVSLYTRAIQHDAANPILFSNRALAYIKLGSFDKAVTDAERCVELDGLHGEHLCVLPLGSALNCDVTPSHHGLTSAQERGSRTGTS
jgi:tetratricopeptide (TPR) repeat protein